MMMPYLPPGKRNMITKISTLGEGENTYSSPFSIKESESRASRNLCSDSFPALQTRKGRENILIDITTPNGFHVRNDSEYHVVDGTVWKKWTGSAWANLQTGVENATATFIDFATGTTLYTVMSDGTNMYSYDGSAVAALASAPSTALITAHKGRIYALSGKTLYFCALNDITDWTTANDAGEIYITNAVGNGSAIATFDDHVCIFTQGSFHELYGVEPLNFQLIDVSSHGCISQRTIKEVIGKGLFWLDNDGIYQYFGGMPSKISDKVKMYIDGIDLDHKSKCCAGSINGKIRFSIPYDDTSSNLVLFYDPAYHTWYPQTGTFLFYAKREERLYALDEDGKFWLLDEGDDDDGEAIEWYYESKPKEKDSVRQKKTLTDLWTNYLLETENTLDLYVAESITGDEFKIKRSFVPGTASQFVRTMMRTPNTEYYRIKFAGEGQCRIDAIEEIFREKGK